MGQSIRVLQLGLGYIGLAVHADLVTGVFGAEIAARLADEAFP